MQYENLIGRESAVHFTFMVDESGSTSSFFNQLSEAVLNTKKRIAELNGSHTYSIIQFDGGARTVTKNRKITE